MNENTALLLGIGIVAGAIIGYIIAKHTNQQVPSTAALVNEEHWAWKDYRGREREMTVHREASSG